ncbi:MAG: hypothetical protein V1787_02280 [Candidatus Micrarchaeota archaeon]
MGLRERELEIRGKLRPFVERSLGDKTPLDTRHPHARPIIMELRRVRDGNGVPYAGHGTFRGYLEKRFGYMGHHGLAYMHPREAIDYAERLAAMILPRQDRRRRRQPLRPEDWRVWDTARRMLHEHGWFDFQELARNHGDLTRTQLVYIVGKLQLAKVLGKAPKRRSARRTKDKRKADEKHELYRMYEHLVPELARQIARRYGGLLERDEIESSNRMALLRTVRKLDKRAAELRKVQYIRRAMINAASNLARHAGRGRADMHITGRDGENLQEGGSANGAEDVTRGHETMEGVRQLLELHRAGRMTENHVLALLLNGRHGLQATQIRGILGGVGKSQACRILKEAKERSRVGPRGS